MGPGMSLVFSGLVPIQMGRSLVSRDPLSSGAGCVGSGQKSCPPLDFAGLLISTAIHASRLSHSEPPSATPSPALSVESLSSESSSHTASTEPSEPPAVPKSSSDPAVHVPGTPGTSGNSVTPLANSSLSSSEELGQPSGEQMPQARTKGSTGTHSTKPFSGATPTPFLLAGDRNPAPSVGNSSPQLQIKVSALWVPKAAFLLAGGCVARHRARTPNSSLSAHSHHYL